MFALAGTLLRIGGQVFERLRREVSQLATAGQVAPSHGLVFISEVVATAMSLLRSSMIPMRPSSAGAAGATA